MLAFIAAKEAATVGSGLATALAPAIGAGTLDGFAVGMLLSGGVFLLLTAQRGPRRTRRPSRTLHLARAVRPIRTKDPSRYQSKHRLTGQDDARPWPEDARPWPEDASPWPENHRRPARHAAPSAAVAGGLVSRFAGLMPLRLLGAGD